MKIDTQFVCMNKDCGTIMVGVGKRMDGLACPRCNGPVLPKPFEQYENKSSAVYQCLCCNHRDRVQVTKEKYQEVLVCPKCNGAFVDIWRIAKYKQKCPESIRPLSGKGITIQINLDGKEFYKVLKQVIFELLSSSPTTRSM